MPRTTLWDYCQKFTVSFCDFNKKSDKVMKLRPVQIVDQSCNMRTYEKGGEEQEETSTNQHKCVPSSAYWWEWKCPYHTWSQPTQNKISWFHTKSQDIRIPKIIPSNAFTFQDGFFDHHTKSLYRVPSSPKHNNKNHMRWQVVASHLTVPMTNPSKFHNALDVNSCLMLFTQEFISRQTSMRNKTTKALQA